MSTYLYLKCLDHDPPLLAEGESGQHLTDLPRIRAELADRDATARTHPDYYAQTFSYHTSSFLRAHRHCAIGIEDEYGRDYDTEEDAP